MRRPTGTSGVEEFGSWSRSRGGDPDYLMWDVEVNELQRVESKRSIGSGGR